MARIAARVNFHPPLSTTYILPVAARWREPPPNLKGSASSIRRATCPNIRAPFRRQSVQRLISDTSYRRRPKNVFGPALESFQMLCRFLVTVLCSKDNPKLSFLYSSLGRRALPNLQRTYKRACVWAFCPLRDTAAAANAIFIIAKAAQMSVLQRTSAGQVEHIPGVSISPWASLRSLGLDNRPIATASKHLSLLARSTRNCERLLRPTGHVTGETACSTAMKRAQRRKCWNRLGREGKCS